MHLHCDARRLAHYAVGDQGSPDRCTNSRSASEREHAGKDQSHPSKEQYARKGIHMADEVRKALPQMDALHYVDVPRGATAYDRDRDCPQRNCIVEAVTW